MNSIKTFFFISTEMKQLFYSFSLFICLPLFICFSFICFTLFVSQVGDKLYEVTMLPQKSGHFDLIIGMDGKQCRGQLVTFRVP